MKRMHIHIGVENLQQSITFYSALFGAEPMKTKTDYAKWMLDDPRINFAISTRIAKVGVDHLGLQVDEESELQELRERLKSADMSIFGEGETVCCYAHSDKSWVEDPSGISWEAYKTMADAKLFSTSIDSNEGACCAPKTNDKPDACGPSEGATGCCA